MCVQGEKILLYLGRLHRLGQTWILKTELCYLTHLLHFHPKLVRMMSTLQGYWGCQMMTSRIMWVNAYKAPRLLSGTQPAPSMLFAFSVFFSNSEIWVSKSFWKSLENNLKIILLNLDFIDPNSISEKLVKYEAWSNVKWFKQPID